MDVNKFFGLLVLSLLGLLSLSNGQKVRLVPSIEHVQKFVNDSYFVSCELSDQSWKAEWLNPRNQRVDTSLQNRVRIEYGNGVDLFLTRITTQDAGMYTCVAKDSRARANFKLTVIRPIVFDTSLAVQSAKEGSSYTLKCRARGENQPRIYWKVDHLKPQPPKYRVTPHGLTISNVTRTDAMRTYLCRAMDTSSPMPDTKLMNITLKVEMPPRRSHQMRTEHWGVVSEWANLTCSVDAEPPATFKWFYRNRTISTSDEYYILNSRNSSTLQVLVKSESKFGKYMCRATNRHGSMEQTLLLNKGQKPATLVLKEVVVGKNAAKIQVSESKSSRTRDPARERERNAGRYLPVIGYIVQYKMMNRADWIFANISQYDEGFIVKGLKPSVTYQIRAAALNQASKGDYSAPIRIITPKTSSWTYSGSPALIYHSDYVYSIVAVVLNLLLHKILKCLN